MFGWFQNKEKPWQSMSSAPRDGTMIEIECRYGFEPWVQKARYIANDGFHGPIWCFGDPAGTYTFINAVSAQSRQNGASEMHLRWRPQALNRC